METCYQGLASLVAETQVSYETKGILEAQPYGSPAVEILGLPAPYWPPVRPDPCLPDGLPEQPMIFSWPKPEKEWPELPLILPENWIPPWLKPEKEWPELPLILPDLPLPDGPTDVPPFPLIPPYGPPTPTDVPPFPPIPPYGPPTPTDVPTFPPVIPMIQMETKMLEQVALDEEMAESVWREMIEPYTEAAIPLYLAPSAEEEPAEEEPTDKEQS